MFISWHNGNLLAIVAEDGHLRKTQGSFPEMAACSVLLWNCYFVACSFLMKIRREQRLHIIVNGRESFLNLANT